MFLTGFPHSTCALAFTALAATSALGQAATTSLQSAPDYVGLTQKWLDSAMANTQAAGPQNLRLEVSFGNLDPRLHLAPCNKVEPYLPTGTRLWGKSRVGLRCLDGTVRWNVFLPVTVKAWGKAWVLNSNVSSGSVLGQSDAYQAEIDWAEDNSPVLADEQQWLGLTASRQLNSGQAIRQSSVRATNAFAAGSQVRVVAQGPGFSITSEGQAVTAGALGQSIRVRMEGGRIVSGLVIDQRTVKIDL